MKKRLLLLLVIPLFYAPQIASHTFGKAMLKQQLEKSWGGSVEIGSVSFHWLKGQSAENVQWTPEDHFTEYGCRKIEWKASLFNLKNPSSAQIHEGSCKIKQGRWALSFPKVEASFTNGAIELAKTPILSEGMLDLWVEGRIDPPQNHLDLVIHIPGAGLKKLFGIKELSDDFVLEVPLSGKLDRFSMDKVSSKILKAFLKANPLNL